MCHVEARAPSEEEQVTDQIVEQLVTPRALAEMLSVSTGQLAQMRYLGTGPGYIKVGTRVRYALPDVQAWLTEQRRTRT